MPTTKKIKQSLVGIELVRLLAYEGDRIFTTDRARELAPRVGLKDPYLWEALYHLRQNGWIVSLRRGLLCVVCYGPRYRARPRVRNRHGLGQSCRRFSLVGPALPRLNGASTKDNIRPSRQRRSRFLA